MHVVVGELFAKGDTSRAGPDTHGAVRSTTSPRAECGGVSGAERPIISNQKTSGKHPETNGKQKENNMKENGRHSEKQTDYSRKTIRKTNGKQFEKQTENIRSNTWITFGNTHT